MTPAALASLTLPWLCDDCFREGNKPVDKAKNEMMLTLWRKQGKIW